MKTKELGFSVLLFVLFTGCLYTSQFFKNNPLEVGLIVMGACLGVVFFFYFMMVITE